MPSSPTLRQRLDLAAAHSYDLQTILLEESADLLRSPEVPLTPVAVSARGQSQAWLPLDLDVSPFDNSAMKKELKTDLNLERLPSGRFAIDD